MNLRKFTPDHIFEKIGIDVKPLFLKSTKYSSNDIAKISEILRIDSRQILSNYKIPDFLYCSAEDLYKTKRKIRRDGIDFYNYYSLPAPENYTSPVILDILCPSGKLPKLNNGHFEEAITINLGPDDIYGRWDEDVSKPDAFSKMFSNKGKENWIVGDTYFEPSYCKHSYSLADNSLSARILSYTSFNDLISFRTLLDNRNLSINSELINHLSQNITFQIIDRYRSLMMIEILDFCQMIQMDKKDYFELGNKPLSQREVKLISKALKIDSRLLISQPNEGDSLGKEYFSYQDSIKNIRSYKGLTVAPMASSRRAPDLKGSFIKVNSHISQLICFGVDIHYLVTGGSVELVLYNSGEVVRNIKMSKDHSIWISAFQEHSISGKGSLVMLSNGQSLSYTSYYAASNSWDSKLVFQRLLKDNVCWGYECDD